MTLRTFVYSLAAFILTSGCASAVEPNEPLLVEFTYALVSAPSAPPGTTWPPTVTTESDRLVLLGRIATGTPCHTVQASAVAIDTIVRVRVLADRGDGFCFDTITDWAYRLEGPLPVNARRLVLQYAVRTNGTTGAYSTVHEAPLAP